MSGRIPEGHPDDRSEQGTNGVREQFPSYWREFLLVSIEPTLAATETLQLLAGSTEPKEKLLARQAEAQRLEREFVGSLLRSDDPTAILDLVERDAVKFFTDFYALNKVFTPPDIAPSSETPAVDWVPLCRFYDRVGQVLDSSDDARRPEAVTTQIFNAIRDLAEDLQTKLALNPESLVEPIQLRFLILLLGCSLFDRFPSISKIALSELHRLHTQISPRNRELLIQWYETLPVDVLKQHVATTEQHITLSVLDASEGGLHALRDSEAPRLRHALGVLKVMFEANKRRRTYLATSLFADALNFGRCIGDTAHDVLAPLSISDFYNDAINAAETLIRFDFIQYVVAALCNATPRRRPADGSAASHLILI